MELLKEWGNIQKKRIIPDKSIFILIAIACLVCILMITFDLPEDEYMIYDGSVDDNTGIIMLSGEHCGLSVIYMYTPDGDKIGEFSMGEKGTRPQFNRVYTEDGNFKFFYHHSQKLYTINTSGKIIDEETLSSNKYWNQKNTWFGWETSDQGLVYSHNGVSYIYNNSSYFKLKFNIENRTFSITDSNGKRTELWTSEMRDTDKYFESLTKTLDNSVSSDTTN